MDDILKKFKALTVKDQLAVYAAAAVLVASFLPFVKVSVLGYSASASWWDGTWAWAGVAGAIVGAAFVILGKPLYALIGFAVAGVAFLLDFFDVIGTDGVGLGVGAILAIAAIAVGLWVTITNFMKKK